SGAQGKDSGSEAVVGQVAGHLPRRGIQSGGGVGLALAKPFVVEKPEGFVLAVIEGEIDGPADGRAVVVLREGRLGAAGAIGEVVVGIEVAIAKEFEDGA